MRRADRGNRGHGELIGALVHLMPGMTLDPMPAHLVLAEQLRSKGVDKVACIAVNDAFVLDAWGEARGTGDAIEFLADGSAAWAKAVGITADLTERGLGVRSGRYAMVVDDGVVKTLNVEDAPGKADVSGADNLLKSL